MPPGGPPATGPFCSGISKPQKAACHGSTSMAIATVTASRNTRHVRRSVTRTWAGKIREIPSCIPTALFDALGRPDRAQALREKAAALFTRFNEAFWDDELGFYAYALDGDKKKVLSVASNAGHCLLAGILPRERAKKVVDRLMARDMWTGWGIRTLSADHPSFNPYNYQTGSVWPHDNALIAMGFKLYGFHAEAARVAHDVSVAASHFILNRLPEFYTAPERSESNFPV